MPEQQYSFINIPLKNHDEEYAKCIIQSKSCGATNQLVFILIIIILFNIVIQPLTLKAQKSELNICFSDTQTKLGHYYDGDFISLRCLVHIVPYGDNELSFCSFPG